MTKKLFFTPALATCLLASAAFSANENARAVQKRLTDEGFYRGEITGQYDSDTAAALTRYQIRHGLAITGKLDAATAKALGVAAAAPNEKGNAPDATTWRQLRQSDAQFLERLNAGQISAPSVAPASPRPRPAATSIPTQTTKDATIEPHGPPPAPPEPPPAAPPIPRPVAQAQSPGPPFGRERIRDYLA
ncbi:MAG: peptidoglycan-binding domain-containing protein, partial [Chthoniobacterales bacterium]